MGNSQRYKLKEKIGKGTFSDVFKAIDTKTDKERAIKRINKLFINDIEENKNSILYEIEIIKKLKNRHTIEYIENYLDNDYFYIVMELCESDLEKELNKTEKGFSLKTIKLILLQLNKVFKLMNENKIIHRDIKLSNILINYKNSILNDFELKLCDFGLSKNLENTNLTASICGTPVNMAPEILAGKPYNNKIDLWSLGIMIYQLCFKEIPFYGKKLNEIKNEIANYKQFKKLKHEHYDKNLQDLIYCLLEIDDNKRISWEEYFNHPFFKEKFFMYENLTIPNLNKENQSVEELKFHNKSITDLLLLNDGRILSTSLDKTFKIFEKDTFEISFELELSHEIEKVIQLINNDLVFGLKNGEILIYDFNNCSEKQKINEHKIKIKNLYELYNEDLLTACKQIVNIWTKNKDNQFIIKSSFKKDNFFQSFLKSFGVSNTASAAMQQPMYSSEMNNLDNIMIKEDISFLYENKNIVCCYEYISINNFYITKKKYLAIKENDDVNLKDIKSLQISIFYKLNEDIIITGHKNGEINIWKINEENQWENLKKIDYLFDDKTRINSILVLPDKTMLIAGGNVIKIVYCNK